MPTRPTLFARLLHPALFLGALSCAVWACNEPSPQGINPADTDTDGNDTQAADTDGLPYDGCLRFEEDGQFAWRHQCGGFSTVQVRFRVDNAAGENGNRTFTFPLFYGGENDTYEKPLVMACCRELNPGETFAESPHVHSCYHDLAENGCRSMVSQLRDVADSSDVPLVARPQLNNIADWLAENQQQCFEAFWLAWRDVQPTDIGNGTPSSFPDHTWDVPSSAETFNIKDIELDVLSPWVDSVEIPASSSERLTCESQTENNDVSFLDDEFDPGFTYDLSSGSVTVAGIYNSNYTEVSGSFASASSNCGACSYVTHRADLGWIDALVLDSDDPADVTWATSSLLTPDRFRIALFSPVELSQVGWNHYRAAPGAASFVLSMSDVAIQPVLWAKNANALDIKRDNATAPWKIKPFKLEYTDSEGNLWGIYVKELLFE